MLVLTRKIGEQVQIGENAVCTVLEVRAGQVKLGFEAPLEDVKIHRMEIFQRILEERARIARRDASSDRE